MADTHVFTKKEELINAITHGLGVLFSATALVILIIASVDKSSAQIVGFIIYGTSMLLLYLSSTLVHSFPNGKLKDIFQVVDHSMIYFFIAGTYTPILLYVIEDSLGNLLMWVVWGITVLGVIFKVFFTKKFLFTSTIIYIAMGWLMVFFWEPLFLNLETAGLILLFGGGIIYTLGTVFYMWRSFPYHHAVWHVFVLVGSVFHFFAILLYV